MPDYKFDLHAPHPNVDIDTMRQSVVQAITEAQDNAAGVDDAYFLTDLLFSLLETALAAIDNLTGRLAALEAPPAEEPPA